MFLLPAVTNRTHRHLFLIIGPLVNADGDGSPVIGDALDLVGRHRRRRDNMPSAGD